MRRDVERTLAAEACRNLIAGRDPAAMAEFFAALERKVTDAPFDLMREPPALPSFAPRRVAAAPAGGSGSDEALMREYVRALKQRLGKEAPSTALLYRALKEFVKQSPISSLTDTDRVAAAYGMGWKRSAQRDRIPAWRRRKVDHAVRGFLTFLHERGLAAPQPRGLSETSLSLSRRVKESLSGSGRVIGLGIVWPRPRSSPRCLRRSRRNRRRSFPRQPGSSTR